MLPIVRTGSAREDLIAIWLGIATENPDAANRVIDAIEGRWRQLAYHPYSGVARDEIGLGICHLVTGRYLTLYRIANGTIQIVRVLHGKQNVSPASIG